MLMHGALGGESKGRRMIVIALQELQGSADAPLRQFRVAEDRDLPLI